MEVEGQRIQIGPVEKFLEQRPLRLRIADMCRRLMRGFSKEAWFDVVDLMLRAQEVRHIEEATAYGTLERYLRAYLTVHAMPPEEEQESWQKLASESVPFYKDGQLYIAIDPLRIFIIRSLNENVTVPELATLFNRFSFRSSKLSGRHPQTGRVFSKKFWAVPAWVLQPLDLEEAEKERQGKEDREFAIF